MVDNEQNVSEFDKMFDLEPSVNVDDNEQAEEYAHSSESDEPFDQLAKEMSDQIKSIDDKGADIAPDHPKDIINSICGNEKKSCSSDDVEEDMFADDLIPAPPEAAPTPPEVASTLPEVASALPEEEIIMGTEKKGMKSDNVEWMLDSPSAMYNSLYIKKKELLFKHMVGGQVEYTRWMDELAEAKVDIRGEIFDNQLIIRQMEEVQQNRERVKYIQIRVNNQYYMFKRYIEMMRGFLARIEYIKPVSKQEGLIMEHMRDIELYYTRLEALHDSANKTEKTLGAAFDTLSRKATICMELKPAERRERQDAAPEEVSSRTSYPVAEKIRYEKFDEYDDLPSNAQAVPLDHKVGQIGWGEI